MVKGKKRGHCAKEPRAPRVKHLGGECSGKFKHLVCVCLFVFFSGSKCHKETIPESITINS